MKKTELIEALGITYAAVGQEISDAALEIIAGDLSNYPLNDVLEALGRCRMELRKIALADILDRMPNGHPGPEEAWAMVNRGIGNEQKTLVLTGPMRVAFFAADELADDEVAARMAFKEVYIRELNHARQDREPMKWYVIQGHDKDDRDATLIKAVSEGKINPSHANTLISHKADSITLDELIKLAPPATRKSLVMNKIR